jgi:hypothetical protein
MTILTYPATPAPLISAEWQEEYGDIHSSFGPWGVTFTNSLLRFPLRTFPFPYLASNADRNTMRAFIANARRQGNRFWTFWPVSMACYDQYIGGGGPWTLTGCMVYDASTLTYTDETDDANNATASDVSVHPVAGTGDEIIILSDHKFDLATFTIATPGAGTYTISSWKYSKNDGTWAAATVTDDTTNFKASAGVRDAHVTMPTDWDTVTVNNATGYGLKAIFDAGTVTTAPLVTLITVNSLIFDLPGSGLASGTTTIYKNGTVITGGGTDYTFVTAGGGGGADRMTLAAYPTQGDLFTCDFTGKVRILGFFGDNAFKEGFPAGGTLNLISFMLTIREDRR